MLLLLLLLLVGDIELLKACNGPALGQQARNRYCAALLICKKSSKAPMLQGTLQALCRKVLPEGLSFILLSR